MADCKVCYGPTAEAGPFVTTARAQTLAELGLCSQDCARTFYLVDGIERLRLSLDALTEGLPEDICSGITEAFAYDRERKLDES